MVLRSRSRKLTSTLRVAGGPAHATVVPRRQTAKSARDRRWCVDLHVKAFTAVLPARFTSTSENPMRPRAAVHETGPKLGEALRSLTTGSHPEGGGSLRQSGSVTGLAVPRQAIRTCLRRGAQTQRPRRTRLGRAERA